jgi:hypothetical protein
MIWLLYQAIGQIIAGVIIGVAYKVLIIDWRF